MAENRHPTSDEYLWQLREARAHIAALEADRARLVAEALMAAEQERKRLAEALHDGAVQDLLVARQELAEVLHGDPEAIGRLGEALDRVLIQARDEIRVLYPSGLTGVPLPAALEMLAQRMSRLSRFSSSVNVAVESATPHDELVFATVRELLLNAGQHSAASHVSVDVARRGTDVVVEVADDGIGIDPRRRESAAVQGHIGLVNAARRVEEAGGSLEVSSRKGEGTRIRAVLPDAHGR